MNKGLNVHPQENGFLKILRKTRTKNMMPIIIKLQQEPKMIQIRRNLAAMKSNNKEN